ncbi:MAG: histidinol-phosphate transaminase [Balneolaceae bacterium]|nr:histidinol-phosphate transaminase [Balneolaceae bacterium]
MSNKKSLVPHNIDELKAYVPGKTIAEVKEQFKPERISKLASNENRLGRSKKVDEAVNKALEIVHDYPDPAAHALRNAIASRYSITADRIMCGAGSESLLAGLCRTFFLNKENLITADATFIGIYVQAKIRGIKVKRIPLTKGYRFDVKAIVNAVDEQTKMIYIANPNNPTGSYITKDEYALLLGQVPEDVLIVMDEAYYEYANSVSDYPDVMSNQPKNVIILRTFSKGYGLAGFRVGYAIADPEIITYLMKTRLAFEPGTLAQAAALAAFDDNDFMKKSTQIVEEGKRDLYQFFDNHSIKYVRSAANFVMIEMLDGEAAEFVTSEMLKKGVILRRINAFGLPDCIRITIGIPEEMEHFKTTFREIYLNSSRTKS